MFSSEATTSLRAGQPGAGLTVLVAEGSVGARVRQRDREAIVSVLVSRRPVPPRRRVLDGVRRGGDGNSDHMAAARLLHGSRSISFSRYVPKCRAGDGRERSVRLLCKVRWLGTAEQGSRFNKPRPAGRRGDEILGWKGVDSRRVSNSSLAQGKGAVHARGKGRAYVGLCHPPAALVSFRSCARPAGVIS